MNYDLKISQLEKEISRLNDIVTGKGKIVCHGKEFHVDSTVKLSELVKEIYRFIDNDDIVITSKNNGNIYIKPHGTGELFLGSSATNRIKIKENGTLVFEGDSTTVMDINLPTSAMTAGATIPTQGALFGSNIRGWLFAGGTSGTSDEIHASGEEINHFYKGDSDIVEHVHFYNSTAIGTSNKDVTIYTEVAWTNDNGQPVISTKTINYTYPDNTPAWTLKRLDLQTLAGFGYRYGSQVSLMFRRVRDANNTYVDNIHPSSIGFHVECDQFGSDTVSSK